jgi:hypothetical protein
MLHCMPVQVSQHEYDLVVIADESTIERMRRHDPAIFQMDKMPPPWPRLRLRSAYFCFEDSPGIETLKKLIDQGAIDEARQFLLRGFQERPDLGDSDDPYHSPDDKRRLN